MKLLKLVALISLLNISISAQEQNMTPIQTPVTGKEFTTCENDSCQKHAALDQFYKAFNTGDMKLMAENWHNDENIAMDNPLGGIKRGWGEIKAVYERIFNGGATVYVEFYDFTIIEFDGGFVAIGRERGSVEVKGKTVELKIRTSRVYKLIDGSYKQVHHHGSIEDPALLKEYQDLVR